MNRLFSFSSHLLPTTWLKKLSREQRRYFDVIVGGLLVVLVPLVIATLQNPGKASAAWYDDSWGYRKAVTVTVTTNASDITNLQTLLTIDANALGSSKLQTNCQDLRFTNANGKLLNYYIDTCTNSTAASKVWVMLDLVPKNTTTYVVYMYYGNPTAVAGSNSGQFDNLVGLKGYWTMNDGGSSATATDSSIGGKNATLSIGVGGTQTTNTQAWTNGASGQYSGSLNFDGDDYAKTSGVPTTTTTTWTLEAWVNPANLAQGPNLAVMNGCQGGTCAGGAGGGYGFGMGNGSGGSGSKLQGAVEGIAWIDSGYTFPSANQWYHVVMVRSGGIISFYVNGQQTSGTSNASITTPVDHFAIGAEGTGSAGSRYFSGKVDDTKIYDVARTASQIVADYANTSCGGQTCNIATTAVGTITPSTSFATEEKATGPVGYWKFDEGTGTSAKDSTASNLTGTLTNSPTWQTEDQCISGKCLYFDGSAGSFVDAGNNLNFATTDSFSISTWFKTNSLAAQQAIVAKGASGNCYNYVIFVGTSGQLQFGNTNTQSNIAANGTIATNQWYHLVVTYNNGSETAYVNGIASGVTAALSTSTCTASLKIGVASASASKFKGFIDEFKIYNYALTQAQITANFNTISGREGVSAKLGANPANSSALSNGLVGYWKMDEASWNGTTAEVKDASGNGNTGTAACSSATICSGTSTGSNTSTTLNDTGKSWTTNAFANSVVYITGGTGSAQSSVISSNTTTQLTVATAFSPTPDATSTYKIVPSITSGKFRNGANFANSATAGQVTLSNAYTYTNTDLTWSTWVKNVASAGTSYFVVQGKGGYAGISFSGTSSTLSFGYSGSSTTSSCSWSTASTSWVHLAVTVNTTTAQMSCYLNGALTSTATVNADQMANNTQGSLCFGRRCGVSSDTFSGQVDEVRFYKRVLSVNEIRTLYDFAPGPVGYWNFEEGSGTSLIDRTGNTSAGTWTGSGSPHWVPGKYGKAGNFDGVTDYVTVNNPLATSGVTTITMSAWIYLGTNFTGRWLVGSDGFIHLEYVSGTFGFKIAGGGTNYLGSAISLDNKWHHLAITLDKNTSAYVIYSDGVIIGSGSVVDTYTGTISTFRIGNTLGFSKTMIDEVKLYSYVRSSKQIVEDMNAGHPAPGSPVGSAVGYWKFDEGADNTCSGGVKDFCNSGSAGNTLDGTITTSVVPATITSGWQQAGKFGKAFATDGVNDYSTLPDVTSATDFVYNEDFSVSFWMKDGGGNANAAAMIEKWAGGAGGYPYVFRYNTNNSVNFARYDGTNNPTVTGTKAINDGAWHYITGVKDGSTLRLYIDGIQNLTATDTTTGTTTNATAVYLGSRGGTTAFWAGYLDEIKIYNSALTADQVKLDYNRGQAQVLGTLSTIGATSVASSSAGAEYCVPGDSTSCAAPVGRWNMNEGISTVVNDTSGNGNTGTLTIGATGTQTTSAQAWKPSKIGKSLNFDGTDDYIDVASSSTLSGTSLTAEAWIYIPASIPAGYKSILEHNRSGGNHYGLWKSGAGAGNIFHWRWCSTGTCTTDFTTTISADTWYHVVGTYDAATTTAKTYINGKLDTTVTSATAPTSVTSGLLIGKSGSGEFWTGKINNVQLFTYARTPAQIAWDYNKGGPVGWWKFDECQGTVANDNTGNGNTGTITIGATGTYTSAGTCPVSSASSMWYNGATGKRNYSLAFDGTDDYVAAGTSSTLNTTNGEITVSAWVKPVSVVQYDGIASRLTSPALTGWSFSFDTNNRLRFFADNNVDAYSNNSAVTTGTWQHVAVTYKTSGAYVFYVNGITVGSGTDAGTITDSGRTMIIGRFYENVNNYYFDGQIDDARVYNYALTSTQVKNLMNDGAIRYGPVTGAP